MKGECIENIIFYQLFFLLTIAFQIVTHALTMTFPDSMGWPALLMEGGTVLSCMQKKNGKKIIVRFFCLLSGQIFN